MILCARDVVLPFVVGLAGTIIFVKILMGTSVDDVQAHINIGYEESMPRLFPYHHVIEQMEWLTAYSGKTDTLSFGRQPAIFYDRKVLYHPTKSDGCRYKCSFPKDFDSLTKGDAAVFSNSFSTKAVAELKDKGVIIAYESGECPIFMPQLDSELSEQVDIFINYMPFSPVPWLYPFFVRNTTPTLRFSSLEKSQMLSENCTHLLPPYHRNRTKLIAWVVSNGYPANNRNEFAEAISTFLPVDIYGKEKMALPDSGNPFEWLSKSYKFYLSFENSNCRYYITEKAQRNALSNGMVPIVLGAYKEDYESTLPPHSYINVDDFTSIKELTEYLQYLDKNDTAYASYFAWTKHGRIVNLNRPDCRLCGFISMLNAGNISFSKPNPSLFTDANKLCFERPLLPLK